MEHIERATAAPGERRTLTDPLVEAITYEVEGVTYDGRDVWHVEPPGPVGSGVLFNIERWEDRKGDDGLWERHIFEWRLA